MKIFSIQSNIIAGIILLFFSCQSPKEQVSGYYQPWVELEELFVDVQMSGVFEDSKLFVDCTPLNSPQAILASYREQKGSKDFDLESFVLLNFSLPVLPDNSDYMVTADLEDHLNSHWDYLTRNSQVQDGRSTLITLPETYVVPGGRFREIYYWDSYFTMIGLVSSGRTDLLISMLDNFAFLIDTIGFIPNGNRTYYLGRSQPPFFAAMVNILIQSSGREEGLRYLPAIEKEYRFWMEGSDQVSKTNPSSRRVVFYNGTVLNRYWDDLDFARPESYREDSEMAHGLSDSNQKELYRNIRAAAESGWDFSARWFEDIEDFGSIRTTEILPIDLNSLLYSMELTLSQLYEAKGDVDISRRYQKLAENRYEAINTLFWNSDEQVFSDIVWTEGAFSKEVTAASYYPMYFKAARRDYAEIQSSVLQEVLLFDGGLATTTIESGQQWDFPNGWAPLQWIAIRGLEHYGQNAKANEIKQRWLRGNQKVFLNTGKMMEKYNVADTTLVAGGGEYPTQDGFGWTNGVYLGLITDELRY